MVNLQHRVQVIFGQTGAENIGRGLQTITQAGTQANTTLSQTAQNLNQFNQATQQGGNGISIFGRNMQGLAGSTTQASQGISIFNNNAKTMQGGLTSMNTLLPSAASQTTGFGTSVKNTASSFGTLAIGISTTAQGAISLMRNYRDLNDLQINIDRTARKVSTSQEAVEKAQTKLTEAQTKFGKGSKEAAIAQRDLTQAEEMLSVQTRMLEEQHEAFGDFQMNFAMSIIPTVIGAIGTMAQAFTSAGISATNIIPKIQAVATAAKAALTSPLFLGGTAQLVAGAAGFLIGGAVKQQNETLTSTQQGWHDAFIQTLRTVGVGEPQLKGLSDSLSGINEALGQGKLEFHAATTEIKETGTAAATTGKDLAGMQTSSNAWVNFLIRANAEYAKTGNVVAYKTAIDQIATAIGPDGLQKVIQEVNTLEGHSNDNRQTSIATTQKVVTIEELLAAEKAKLVKVTQDSIIANEDETATYNAMAEGSKKGVAQFEALRNTTLSNIQAEKLYRSAIIEKLEPLMKGVDLTKMSTHELELHYKSLLGDVTATKELNKVYEENAAFITDIANKYGTKLNPALALSTKQIQEAQAAFAALDKAITDIRDPSDLFGMKDFKIKFEVEDEFHDFMKNLPKGMRQTIIFNVKSEAANANAKTLMGLIAKTALQDIELGIQFKTDEKGADKFVQETIDSIKDQFKKKGQDFNQDPDIQKAISKLLEIKEAPESWPKLIDYFQSPDFLAVIKKIDPKTAEIIQSLLPPPTDADTPDWLKDPNLDKFLPNARKAFEANNKKNPLILPIQADTTQAEAALGTLTESAGSAWTAVEDMNDSLDQIPDASGKIDPNAKSADTLGKNTGTAWNALEDMNQSLDDVPNVSSTINKNAKAMDDLAKSAGSAWQAVTDTVDALEEADGNSYHATFEVEFKATGDAIAKEKAGGQHGQMFVSNVASIWKGKRISEFNKPELNMTIPLSNPSNITNKQSISIPSGVSLGGSGGGSPNYQSVQLRIDGNSIVRDQDIWANIAPLMGRNMARYRGT